LFGSAHQPPAHATPSAASRGAVFFDALGTLVALEPPAPLLCRGLAERMGIEITAADAERAIAAEISYYRAHLDEGRDAHSLARLRRRCAAVLREALPSGVREADLDVVEEVLLGALRFRAFDDARPALIAARRVPARVVVVSNWDVSLKEVLERVGLTPLLDGVITSAGVGARKPSPQIFLDALAFAGVPPERAVHVGDSVSEDVAGAFGAGIAPVLLRRDGRPGPPGILTIATLAELRFDLWSAQSPETF
jgi:putative hydrolase of the HAD superfamily